MLGEKSSSPVFVKPWGGQTGSPAGLQQEANRRRSAEFSTELRPHGQEAAAWRGQGELLVGSLPALPRTPSGVQGGVGGYGCLESIWVLLGPAIHITLMKSQVVALPLAMATLAGLDPHFGKACAQAMGRAPVPLPHHCFLPKGEVSTSQAPLLTAACSGKLEQHTERRGVIYSPSWPLNYPPGTNCSWYIQGDRGDMITIRYGTPGGVSRNLKCV